MLAGLLGDGGFADIEQRAVALPLRMPSAAETLVMMQEAFGAYRAVISDQPEHVQAAAWAEVAKMLKEYETPNGFETLTEVCVAAGTKPAGPA